MTQPADHASIGFESLRDHSDVAPHERDVLGGWRSDLLRDKESSRPWVGDHINWAYWGADEKQREVGGWSMAWPGLMGKDADGLRPLKSAREIDERFKALGFNSGDDKQKADRGENEPPPGDFRLPLITGQKVPGDMPGIMLAGTREDRQENIFFPIGGVEIAHHRGNSPPQYSTHLHDIQGDRLGVHAGWHGALWVQQLPDGGCLQNKSEFVPALNLAVSTGDTTGRGAFVARGVKGGRKLEDPDTGQLIVVDATLSGNLCGWLDHTASGPIHVGAENDQHRVGVAKDGTVWNSGHISTGAYFFADEVRDGPIDFEPVYRRGRDLNVVVPVHLAWDNSDSHDHVCGTKRGKWKAWATSAIRPPIIDEPKPPYIPFKPPNDLLGPFPDPSVYFRPQSLDNIDLGGGTDLSRYDWGASGKDGLFDPARAKDETSFPSLHGHSIRKPDSQPRDGRWGDSTGLTEPAPPPREPSDELTGRRRRREEYERQKQRYEVAPLVWSLQTVGVVDSSGEFTPVAGLEAGEWSKEAISSGVAKFGPFADIVDAEDPPAVNSVALLMYNGSRGGSAAQLAWGDETWTSTLWKHGFAFAPVDDGSGNNDAEIFFRDSSGTPRVGVLNVGRDSAPAHLAVRGGVKLSSFGSSPGDGYLWVNGDTLWWTDHSGVDHQLV